MQNSKFMRLLTQKVKSLISFHRRVTANGLSQQNAIIGCRDLIPAVKSFFLFSFCFSKTYRVAKQHIEFVIDKYIEFT